MIYTAFARNDLRGIRRDSMLVGVLIGPFIYAVGLWFVPAVTDFGRRAWDFDLLPYHPLIVSMFAVLGPMVVLGSLCGLLLLEEKDQRTLSALRVTPVPPSAYPTYRGAMTILLVTGYTIAVLALSRLAPLEVVLKGLPIGLVSGLVAMIVAMIMAGPANNKVEGLAIGKALGMFILLTPLGAFFVIGSPWEYVFGVLPTYWPARALWAAWDGTTFWPFIAGGLLWNTLIAVALLRAFRGRLG